VPEAYVHRIGRTARAGADGSAVAFCADDERGLLKDIEKVTRQKHSRHRSSQRQVSWVPEPKGVKPERPDTRKSAQPHRGQHQPRHNRNHSDGQVRAEHPQPVRGANAHPGAPRTDAVANTVAPKPAFKGPRRDGGGGGGGQRSSGGGQRSSSGSGGQRSGGGGGGRTGVWSNR
jgi:ATP-dependent RNA helicase RhlE